MEGNDCAATTQALRGKVCGGLGGGNATKAKRNLHTQQKTNKRSNTYKKSVESRLPPSRCALSTGQTKLCFCREG